MPYWIDDLDFMIDDTPGVVEAEFHRGVTVSTVKGILDTPYLTGMPIVGSLGVETSEITFGCRESDVLGIKHNDFFIISGVTYYAKNPKPDGDGWETIILSRDM